MLCLCLLLNFYCILFCLYFCIALEVCAYFLSAPLPATACLLVFAGTFVAVSCVACWIKGMFFPNDDVLTLVFAMLFCLNLLFVWKTVWANLHSQLAPLHRSYLIHLGLVFVAYSCLALWCIFLLWPTFAMVAYRRFGDVVAKASMTMLSPNAVILPMW